MTFKLEERFSERKDGDVALAKVVRTNEFGEETALVLKQYSNVTRGDPNFDPREYTTERDILTQLGQSEYTVNLKKSVDASQGYPWNT